MHRWVKLALTFSLFSSVGACGAPSGCSALDSMAPLPDGFDREARIENAASLRVTDQGLAFLEQNLPALASNLLAQTGAVDEGILLFPVPTTPASGTGYNLTICPDGPDDATGRCIAEIDVAGSTLKLRSEAPRDIVIEGSVPFRIADLPTVGDVALLPIDVNIAVSGGDEECDPASMSFALIDVTARLSVEVEKDPAHALREGYSKLRIDQLEVDQEQVIAALHACGEGLDDGAINALKGALGPIVLSGFQEAMVSTANQLLCMQADVEAASPCPAGTSESEGLCVYEDGSCVSSVVGLEGHADLGALLQAFSPGTSGGLNFLLAAGGGSPRPDDATLSFGDLNPVGNGATLGIMGGALPDPIASCVNAVQVDVPTGIPMPDEMLANTVEGWTGAGPHVGLALSERYLNYALASSYNAGLFCIGLSTEQVAQLSSGLFGLLVPSIKYLTHQKKNAPIAVVLRPQAPPTVTLGGGTDLETDPLVRVKLDRALFDFYVWSSDRYIRAFTAQVDLDVPVALDVSDAGITPMLDKIYVRNASVSNAGLLREQPTGIASALSDVVEGLAGQFLGDLQPIDVSGLIAPLGLTLRVPAAGIRRLEKDQDAFLGLFAGLDVAPQQPASRTETSAELVRVDVPDRALQIDEEGLGARPTVTLRASVSGALASRGVEFSHRLGRGAWRPWSQRAELVVRDPFLRMQGHHVIEVKSRVVGDPSSEDRTPARVEVTIDAEPPRVWVTPRDDGRWRLEATDLVTPVERMSYRVRSDDQPWGPWSALGPRTAFEAEGIEVMTVEVRDENENVATVQQSLIRGRPAPSDDAGATGCSVSRTPRGGHALFGIALAAAVFAAIRRRASRPRPQGVRSAACALAVLAIAGTWSGCNCLDDVEEAGPRGGVTKPPSEDQCGTWGAPECVRLLPGVIGSYTSVAAAPDGTVWVAGYNEADWNNDVPYGDLVVGKLDATTQQVAWTSVDGVPSEPAPDSKAYDLTSWRGGQQDPGPDVGLWTSLVLDPFGNPRVAYYDSTNTALKLAVFDGTAWSTHTVYTRDHAEAGRYAKLLIVNGKLVVAFQVIEASEGGFATSKVVVGRASSAGPTSASDWTFEDVAVDDETPCRAHLCPTGQACVALTQQCVAKATTCEPKCASGQACIDGVCEPVFDGTKLDAYPDAIGGYISMAAIPGGDVGLVYYDRIRGNLVQARKDGESWVLRVVDGEQGTPAVDTGDMGIGASLFIDAKGDWHVAYVDGYKEALRYLRIQTGNVPLASELVDDGSATEAEETGQGNHVVGDDADVFVTSAGEVHIAYQDATVGKLRVAVGTPQGDGSHVWQVKQVEQPGFAGFFAKQVEVGGALRVVNWWRTGGQSIDGNVRLVVP